jgi:uncharacterized protein YbcI
MPDLATTEPPGQSAVAAISNLVVRVFSEYTGRGPTKARAYINDDLVTVVLRDSLTKGERSLVGSGHHDLVLNMRLAFQQTMRHDLVEGVQTILGRTVDAFLSSNHMNPDIAIESFLLAPRDPSS